MPRLFLPADRVQGTHAHLDDEAHRYLTRVLRLRVDDTLVVFDGAGTEIEARIERADARETVLALGARRQVGLAHTEITLIQAVPRADRMDLIAQKTTELGVSRIVPVWSARTIAQAGAEGRLRRWRTIAQEAARQCGRADVPTIEPPRPLADALAALGPVLGTRLVVWEQTTGKPLRQAVNADAGAVSLLVGAEGGFTSNEVAEAEAVGFRAVSLGPRILRSETAAIVCVALVQSALGGLD